MRETLRTYRAPDDIYLPAMAAAGVNDETVADVIRRALVAYGKANQSKVTRRRKAAERKAAAAAS